MACILLYLLKKVAHLVDLKVPTPELPQKKEDEHKDDDSEYERNHGHKPIDDIGVTHTLILERKYMTVSLFCMAC